MQIYFVSLIVNQDFDKLNWMITPFHGLSLATLKDISNGFLCHLNYKKNPPSIFQRKMDQIFRNYSKFVLVYR